ncbi:hypothetical protein JTB14_012640 [Gonioctena quinquepunctata]|nr:hypothetical protein JTB14_012640 [Gonioctena quinquepunctata]
MQAAEQSELELNDSKEHKKIITEMKKLIEDLQNKIATKNNKRCFGTQTKPVVQKTIGISTYEDEFSAVGKGNECKDINTQNKEVQTNHIKPPMTKIPTDAAKQNNIPVEQNCDPKQRRILMVAGYFGKKYDEVPHKVQR